MAVGSIERLIIMNPDDINEVTPIMKQKARQEHLKGVRHDYENKKVITASELTDEEFGKVTGIPIADQPSDSALEKVRQFINSLIPKSSGGRQGQPT